MLEQDLIEHIKEKTRKEYQQQLGIWDLPLAMLILLYCFQTIMHIHYVFAIMVVPIIRTVYTSQKKYVFPRLGRVEFDSKVKKQNRLFLIILCYLLFSVLAAVVFVSYKTGKGSHVNPGSLTLPLSLVSAVVVALGGFMRRTVLYIYASVIMLPLVLGLYYPASSIIAIVTAFTIVTTSALLKLYVYDWTGLDKAQQRPGITGHYLVGFIALGVMIKLIFTQINPALVQAFTAQTMVFKNSYAGILTAGLIFLVGYAFSIKSYYWYSGVIVMFSIVYRLQLMSRFYFIWLFMLFAIGILIYRFIILERFVRLNPKLDDVAPLS